MKKIILCTIMIIMCLITCACSEKLEEKNTGKLPSSIDKLYCSLKNADYTFYENLTSSYNVDFYIIAPEKINENEVEIKIDASCEYDYSVIEEEEEFPYYVYQMYNDFDWGKLEKLEKEDTAAYCEYRDSFLEEYEENKDKVAELHRYNVYMSFKAESNCEIKQINITVGKYCESFQIGSIKIEKEPEVKIDNEGIEQENIAITDYIISPSEKGLLPLSDQYNFYANKDIIIEKIYTLSGDEIKNISIDITNNDLSMNEKWDGNSDFKIYKGAHVTIRGDIVSEMYKKEILFSTQKYVLLDYHIGEDNYTMKIDYSYMTDVNMYEMVALMKDDIDIMKYYSYIDSEEDK